MRIRTKPFPEIYPIGLLLLLTAILLAFYFGPVLLHPNNYLMAAGGDGLKTYYSSSWYVMHNPEGATHTGFAYPNGNHMVYADLNPLLSACFRFVNNHLFDISAYIVALTNLTLILSFLPCAFFVYLILRKNLLPQGFALIFALSITWLSPQIDRITGHYALSYLFFVPMLWYILIRVFERKNTELWLGLYAMSLLLFEFAHPYHFLIGAGFLYAYLFVHALQHIRSFRKNLRVYLGAALLGFLPIVALKGWEVLTISTATDFVKYPFGFLYYTAGFETLFVPWKPTAYNPSPFWEAWNYLGIWERIIDPEQPRSPMEGAAYVGLVGLLVLAGILWRSLTYLWRRRARRIVRPVLPAPLQTGIWAAALLLILASAWPFRTFSFLLDWFDFVRQFRSLGRLAWPFYYTFMTLSAFYLYALYRILRSHSQGTRMYRIGLVIMALAVISWGLDARILTKRKKTYFLQNAIDVNYPDWKTDYKALLAEHGHQPEDFQAILAFPFYHIGSEKLAMEGWHASFYSKAASLSTGLPIVNNYTARAPLTPSLETINLVSHPYIPKTLVDKFPNKKPLLLLYTYTDEEAPLREKNLIDQSELILRHNKMHFAVLPLSAFADKQDEARRHYFGQKAQMVKTDKGYQSDNSSAVIEDGFGDALFSGGRIGTRAKEFPFKGRMMLYDGVLTGASDGLEMEASVWVKLDRESNYLPQLICQQFEGETAVTWDWAEMKTSTDVSGQWVRASLSFVLQKADNRLTLFADGDHLIFDNLLIRPKTTDVYSPVQSDGSFVVNNYLIESP